MPENRSDDTPRLTEPDDVASPAGSVRTTRIAADGDVGALVADALEAMTASGERAEDDYQRTVSALREHAAAATTALVATYEALDEQHYLERWSVVQLLTDLRPTDGVEALASIARQPIPPEHSDDPAHGFSTVGEEVIIRTTAVEALGRLLAGGNREAGERLLALLDNDVVSVRRAVVQAVTEHGDARLRTRVRQALYGTDDEWMLALRRIEVAEAPQADGRQFLRGRDGAGDSTPPAPQS